MSNRAYIVLARNDLADNFLQILDLKPNSSLRNQSYEPAGQTHYPTFFVQNSTVALTSGDGGILTTNDTYYGLAAYLVDNVENVGDGNLALTEDQANGIASAILTRVAAGLPLALSDINTVINAEADVSLSDLNGVVTNSESTGSVEAILQILAGSVYKLPAGSQVGNASGAFPGSGSTHTPLGAFTTRPAVSVSPSWTHNGETIPVRGRNSVSRVNPVTVDPEDYHDVKIVAQGGALNLSVLAGNLKALVSPTYTWHNPKFTYGASGTAKTIADVSIGSNYQAAGVVVYDANGNVIS